jgi:hypothetical protein
VRSNRLGPIYNSSISKWRSSIIECWCRIEFMQVTKQIVAEEIGGYLHHQITLEQLVDWAERGMMEGDFESSIVRDVVAHLGFADTRAFGLTWEDCQRLLGKLGFAAQVQIASAK